MTEWMRNIASNSLSYLQNQVTTPLRLRRAGKSPELVREEIRKELKITVSREKDVQRQITAEERNKKNAVSLRSELNFRVANVDDNRQFLFKQTTDYECKLERAAGEQRELLQNYEQLQRRLDENNLQLRSVILNVKGVTELKNATLAKIPKLESNRQQSQMELQKLEKMHTAVTEEITQLSHKRDSLRTHLKNAERQHTLLLNEHEKIVAMARTSKKEKEELSSRNTADDFVEISTNAAVATTITDKSKIDEMVEKEKQWSEKIKQAVGTLHHLHTEVNNCEKELESKHSRLGQIILQQSTFNTETRRMADMISLQQSTLESIEQSLTQYIDRQRALEAEKGNIEKETNKCRSDLDEVKEVMRNCKDDIHAIADASRNLSDKKLEFAVKLKDAIAKEKEIEEKLKILHRNRMTLRARKAQLVKDQILLEESDQLTTIKNFVTQTAQVVRLDINAPKRKIIRGTLTVSPDNLIFTPNDTDLSTAQNFTVRHEIADVSHSYCNVHHQLPTLRVFLLTNIQYHGSHIHDPKYRDRHQKKRKVSKKSNPNGLQTTMDESNATADDASDASSVISPYLFKIMQSDEKEKIQSVHSFLKSRHRFMLSSAQPLADELSSAARSNSNLVEEKRDELEPDSSLLNIDNEKEKMQRENPSASFSLVPRESDFEEKPSTASVEKVKEIILKCPPRTHMWKWKLYYSTARHGISMSTFYRNLEDVDESLIIIRDTTQHIFGAFVDVGWQISDNYRGSIDCFVFRFDDDQLCCYRASGVKSYFLRSNLESITIGAGECPALYVDSDFNFGRTTKCATFESPPLTTDCQFQAMNVEVWGPSSLD